MTTKKLVPIGGGGGSGVVTFPTNVLAPFRRLAELGDELVERYGEIRKLSLSHLRGDAYDPDSVELPEDWQFTLPDEDIGKARALLQSLDLEHAYYEDEDEDARLLKRSVIGDRISVLIGSFPTGQVAAPENYARMLIEHIAAERPCFLTLHSACIQLERERKTLPSVAAVLETLAEQQAKWDKRRHAIFQLPSLCKSRLDELRAARPKVEVAKRVRAMQSATNTVNNWRRELIKLQTEAATAAQKVAAGFERLAAAEEKLRAAQAALAAARTKTPDGDGGVTT